MDLRITILLMDIYIYELMFQTGVKGQYSLANSLLVYNYIDTRSELASLAHSFIDNIDYVHYIIYAPLPLCLALHGESERDAIIISAFIASLHCACS